METIMKRSASIIFVIASFLFFGSNLYAFDITIESLNKGTNIDGGEFFVTTDSNALEFSSFGTFCLETDEYVYPPFPTTYDATLNDKAIKGGSNTNSGDPIDERTAWIYRKYLNGYYGSNLDSDKAADIQKAIWFIEDEGGGVENYIVTAANKAKVKDQGNFFGIRVLNLFDDDGNYRQDMLAPVPEPTTMLLFGTGLFGLAAFGRKKFFNKG